MTSFIIASKDQSKRLDYARNYSNTLHVDLFDITIINKESNTKQESIGIEDIKNIQKKIFLKPFKSNTKVIIIDDSHLLTIEAQNALLKVLEEPPSHTVIMLLAESKENLLPTIISRCKVIELHEETFRLTDEEVQACQAFIKHLPILSVGECLKKAEILAKDKTEAITWVAKLTLLMRENLLKMYASNEAQTKSKSDNSSRIIKYINSFQKLTKLLKSTNVNPRMAIENALLSLL